MGVTWSNQFINRAAWSRVDMYEPGSFRDSYARMATLVLAIFSKKPISIATSIHWSNGQISNRIFQNQDMEKHLTWLRISGDELTFTYIDYVSWSSGVMSAAQHDTTPWRIRVLRSHWYRHWTSNDLKMFLPWYCTKIKMILMVNVPGGGGGGWKKIKRVTWENTFSPLIN